MYATLQQIKFTMFTTSNYLKSVFKCVYLFLQPGINLTKNPKNFFFKFAFRNTFSLKQIPINMTICTLTQKIILYHMSENV